MRSLAARVEAIEAAGVDWTRLVLDPGLGFRQAARARLGPAARVGRPAGPGPAVAACASRKSFLGRLLGSGASLRLPDERDAATTALTTWLALRHPSVWGVRVHDVRATCDALAVLERLTRPSLEEAAP